MLVAFTPLSVLRGSYLLEEHLLMVCLTLSLVIVHECVLMIDQKPMLSWIYHQIVKLGLVTGGSIYGHLKEPPVYHRQSAYIVYWQMGNSSSNRWNDLPFSCALWKIWVVGFCLLTPSTLMLFEVAFWMFHPFSFLFPIPSAPHFSPHLLLVTHTFPH